jgi:hypothetical protein
VTPVRSRQLQAALTAFAEQASDHLNADVLAGEEVPFELASQSSRGRSAAPLYCYRPLTGAFIAKRFPSLAGLPARAPAAELLHDFDGLDRYLLSRDIDPGGTRARARADAALLAFLQDLFEEQTDFELRPERLARALARIEGSALANPAEITLVATLHGLAIASQELRLTSGLLLAQPHALEGAPEQAVDIGAAHNRTAHGGNVSTGNGHDWSAPAASGRGGDAPAGGQCAEQTHLLVVFGTEDPDAPGAIAQGREILRELVRALRLFGDGRIALGPVAWSRIASGPWSTLALGGGGHPHGMLLVTPDQEDELRAFCNLVSRRAPCEGEVAWALRRFELGCERTGDYEALSDHLLALRALLAGPREAEPAGSSGGLLAARLAALCATPEHRAELTERTLGAIALERAVIAGTAVEHAGGLELARTLSNNLRALLRDLICGHLPSDLVTLADELLLSGGELSEEQPKGHDNEELVFAETA